MNPERKAIKLPDNWTISIEGKLVQRKAIKLDVEEVDWNQLYSEIQGLILYAAKNIYYNNYNFCQSHLLEIDDLYQEGQLVVYDCWCKYKYKSYNDVLSMSKSSIWRRLRDIVMKKYVPTTDIDSLVELGIEPSADNNMDEDLDTETKLNEVRNQLKEYPISLIILQEYLQPSSITVEEMNKDMENKLEQVRLGILPNTLAPKALKLTKVVVERSITRMMGITKVSFKEHFKILQKALKSVFSK